MAGVLIMRKALLFIVLLPLFLFQCSLSMAAEYPKYQVDVSSNYDGDTITITNAIPIYLTKIRVKGVDTPEIGWRARCPREQAMAIAAKKFTADKINTADTVVLDWISPDRNGGRIAARVMIDGVDLADLLIHAGLGHKFGSKENKPKHKAGGWCQ